MKSFACLLLSMLVVMPVSAEDRLPQIFRQWLPKMIGNSTPAPPPVVDPLAAPDTAPSNRDPTQAQGELQQLLNQRQATPQSPAAAPALPPLQLRGKVVGAKGASAILSWGENQWLFVQPGQKYLLAGFADSELSVLEVNSNRVVVELLPQGRKLILP